MVKAKIIFSNWCKDHFTFIVFHLITLVMSVVEWSMERVLPKIGHFDNFIK